MNTAVRLEGLTKRFVLPRRARAGGERVVVALDGVSLDVPAGEMLVLLGPSGCGKTTTLRCAAGLERPDSGRIVLGGDVVFDAHERVAVPSHKRDIGLVFQSFALWPHLTAAQNVEFPLKARRVRRDERAGRVREIAQRVELDATLLDKRPGELSGGQQQRVALARALVSEPRLVLFDEPLSNLDALLREQLRAELKELHGRLAFTGIFVTHDLNEAMAVGDRIACMRAGRIVQIGAADDVFSRPATVEIARSLGMRSLCVLERRDGGWQGGAGVRVTGSLPPAAHAEPDVVEVLTRPETVQVLAPGTGEEALVRVGDAGVASVSLTGMHRLVAVEYAGRRFDALCPRRSAADWTPGDRVELGVAPEDVHLFDASGDRWDARGGAGAA
jgi:iron(III) transport system ATP-binding protein